MRNTGKKIFGWSFISLMLIFVYAPIVILIIFSFAPESKTIGNWSQISWSLGLYEELFESEDILDDAQNIAYESIDKCLMKGISDWGKIKSVMRDDLSDHIWKPMKRRPMILPILIEG